MSRFTNVFEKEYSNETFDGCPAVMQKIRIIFDNEEDRCVIQFKLKNTGAEIIEKVFLKIKLLDSKGKNIKTINDRAIPASAQQDESFGEDSPLYYRDKKISSCEAIITKVILKNREIWKNKPYEKRRTTRQRIIIYPAIVCGAIVLFNAFNIFLASNSDSRGDGFNGEGIAVVEIAGKDCMINRLGFVLKRADDIEPNYGADGYRVNKNGKWGVVNKRGIWIIKPTYSSIRDLRDSPEYKEIKYN